MPDFIEFVVSVYGPLTVIITLGLSGSGKTTAMSLVDDMSAVVCELDAFKKGSEKKTGKKRVHHQEGRRLYDAAIIDHLEHGGIPLVIANTGESSAVCGNKKTGQVGELHHISNCEGRKWNVVYLSFNIAVSNFSFDWQTVKKLRKKLADNELEEILAKLPVELRAYVEELADRILKREEHATIQLNGDPKNAKKKALMILLNQMSSQFNPPHVEVKHVYCTDWGW